MYKIQKKRKEGYYYVTREYCFIEAHEFMEFETFANARSGMKNTPRTCFMCGHKFSGNEKIWLSPVLHDKNRIVCKGCAEIINKNK